VYIESIHNDKVKYWCKLKEKKFRDEQNLFLIEGDHLVSEALKKGIVESIITVEDKEYEVFTYRVTEQIMKKISYMVSPSKVIAVCHKLEERKIEGPVIFLDGIQDPGNLGTIIRSAAAFSIPNVILSDTSVDLYNEKVIRSTEGMMFHVNILRKNLESMFKKLKDDGYFIIGTDVVSGSLFDELSTPDKTVFIIGSEGKGMSDVARKYCDTFCYIKMNGVCESLNASVTASILMYEFAKRR